MALFQRGRQWYIDYYAQGRRIRERVGPSRREAERAMAARKGEIVQGRFTLQALTPSPRFRDFAQDYLKWAEAHKRSWRTDAGRLRCSLLPFFGDRRLREISAWSIEQYKVHRRKVVKPATANRELALLGHMFTKALEWGRIPVHPMRGGKVKALRVENQVERVVTPEGEGRLLSAASERLRPLLVLALDTGMRRGELFGLTRDQVDLPHGVVAVMQTKSGKARRLPLTRRAREALELLMARAGDSPYIFPAETGGQLTWVPNSFRRACRRAGLQGLRFHDLRHTFATRLVTGGVDIVTVQRLLGHSDIRMTLRYSHPGSADFTRAVALLDQMAANGHKMDTTREVAPPLRAVSA